MDPKNRIKAINYKKGLIAIFAFSALFVLAKSQPKEVKPINKPRQVIAEAAVKKPLIVPEFTNEKKVKFSWRYNGVNYSINETLYQSVYDFYRHTIETFEPPKGISSDWSEIFYGIFLEPAVNDKTFSQIAEAIKNEGLKHGLNDDQIAELALAFVQKIPYDDDKAEKDLLTEDAISTFHPYETLYGQKGICSDKSFLAILLLRELGYGVALFEYDSANHIAVGVKCPLKYSIDNTGYCYAETTWPGHRIGDVPETDLENPVLYQKTDGKVYQAAGANSKN